MIRFEIARTELSDHGEVLYQDCRVAGVVDELVSGSSRATYLALMEQQAGLEFNPAWVDIEFPAYRIPDPYAIEDSSRGDDHFRLDDLKPSRRQLCRRRGRSSTGVFVHDLCGSWDFGWHDLSVFFLRSPEQSHLLLPRTLRPLVSHCGQMSRMVQSCSSLTRWAARVQ